jgi:hypothetical protein
MTTQVLGTTATVIYFRPYRSGCYVTSATMKNAGGEPRMMPSDEILFYFAVIAWFEHVPMALPFVSSMEHVAI